MRVIASQSTDWRGNPFSLCVIANQSKTGVAIPQSDRKPQEIATSGFALLAMTGKSYISRNKPGGSYLPPGFCPLFRHFFPKSHVGEGHVPPDHLPKLKCAFQNALCKGDDLHVG